MRIYVEKYEKMRKNIGKSNFRKICIMYTLQSFSGTKKFNASIVAAGTGIIFSVHRNMSELAGYTVFSVKKMSVYINAIAEPCSYIKRNEAAVIFQMMNFHIIRKKKQHIMFSNNRNMELFL